MSAVHHLSLEIRAFQDHSPDVLTLEGLPAKVDRQSERQVHQLHVGQRLHLEEHRIRHFDSLRFDDKAIIYQQVDAQILIEGQPAIVDRDRCFSL